jgi:hypothetical protein
MKIKIEDLVDQEQFEVIRRYVSIENGEVKAVNWRALDFSDVPTETGSFNPEHQGMVLTTLASAGILSTKEEGNYSLLLEGCLMNPYIKSQQHLKDAQSETLYFTRKEDAEAYAREVWKSKLIEIIQNKAA